MALTRADVVRAGAQLLDSEGLEGLSMRKLATMLSTGPATLYWHVRDKNELLALILDETLQPVQIPESGAWDACALEVLNSCRAVLLPRPMLVRVIWEAGWNIGAESLRVADGLIALVAASGLPDEEVADAYFTLVTYVFGFVLAETSSQHERFASTGEDGATQYPNLVRYGPATDEPGMDRRFEFGLTAILDGIKARVE